MAYVKQDPYLFRGTVAGNLAYGLHLRGVAKGEVRARVAEALAQVGLAGFEDRDARKLSGGEAKRVAIARALALKPEVLLLDEPTANVDRSRVRMVEEQVHRANQEDRTTVILTTHDLNQARRLTDSVVALVDGKLAPVPPDNVFHCEVVCGPDGPRAELPGGVAFQLLAGEPGPAHVAIDPEDIVVSLAPVDSSARNCFSGRVTRIATQGVGVMLDVDVGVELHVQVTRASCMAMGLTPGRDVHVTFKASSVHVL